MHQHTVKKLALAVAGCTALWTVQAAAAGTDAATLGQLQKQIQSLQKEVQQLKSNQAQQQSQMSAEQASASSSSKSSGPVKKLSVGGGVVAEYQKTHNDAHGSGGSLVLDYFDLNVAGQYGKLTYGADYRWSTTNFKSGQYLHYAWADYAFGKNDSSHVRGGMFQVPFGNLPYGYQSFWANLNYYAGFADDQAAGLGYKYENNGWRFDLDAFKDQGLEQQSTYGGNPNKAYKTDSAGNKTNSGARLVNGGNARLGRTIKLGGDKTLNLSVAARGGELEYDTNASGNTKYGTRWAGTLAAEADLGNWVLQGQFVDYKYNIPNDIYGGNTEAVWFQDYGYGYWMPAKGQLYSASVGRTFNVSNMGPISSFEVYNDYGYLHSGYGNYDNDSNGPNRIGDVQENTTGIAMFAGPVDIWAEWIESKNGAMAFDGPNNGSWHGRFNLAAAFYFDGDLIKK